LGLAGKKKSLLLRTSSSLEKEKINTFRLFKKFKKYKSRFLKKKKIQKAGFEINLNKKKLF